VKTSNKRLVAGAMAGVLVLAACGGDDTSDSDGTTGGGAAVDDVVGGSVFVSGSSTVEPISIRVAELAGDSSGGALAVTVEGPGTG